MRVKLPPCLPSAPPATFRALLRDLDGTGHHSTAPRRDMSWSPLLGEPEVRGKRSSVSLLTPISALVEEQTSTRKCPHCIGNLCTCRKIPAAPLMQLISQSLIRGSQNPIDGGNLGIKHGEFLEPHTHLSATSSPASSSGKMLKLLSPSGCWATRALSSSKVWGGKRGQGDGEMLWELPRRGLGFGGCSSHPGLCKQELNHDPDNTRVQESSAHGPSELPGVWAVPQPRKDAAGLG